MLTANRHSSSALLSPAQHSSMLSYCLARDAGLRLEVIAVDGRDVRVLGLVLPLIIGLLLGLIIIP